MTRSRVVLGVWVAAGAAGLLLLKRRDPEMVIGAMIALPYVLVSVAGLAAEVFGVRWRTIPIAVVLGIGLWYAGWWAFVMHRSRLARTALDTAIHSVRGGSRAAAIRLEWVGDSTSSRADFAAPYQIEHEDTFFAVWEFLVHFTNGAEYQIDVLDTGTGVWLVRPFRGRRASP